MEFTTLKHTLKIQILFDICIHIVDYFIVVFD